MDGKETGEATDSENKNPNGLDIEPNNDILIEEEEEIEDEKPIDDDEFNIPPVDFEPTLESILNDVETGSLSDEETRSIASLAVGQLQQTETRLNINESHDNISIASKGSDSRSRTSGRSIRFGQSGQSGRPKPNSILKHVVLKAMTMQINSASEKYNAGSASAIAIGPLIGVGTTQGHILIFDGMQNLKYCFWDQKVQDEGGSVSALEVSQNGTRLLAGYSKGLILMYNLENGKLLRTMNEMHATSTALIILRFTDISTLSLCSDSGGSVFELNFNRTMGIRGCESRCIFSGSRGEVCTFEPLLLSAHPENTLRKFVIVALATLSKVIVVTIRPKLKVLFTHPLASDPTTLPLLAWQMVIIQTSKNEKIIDPVLTFARDHTMYFYQITLDTRNVIQFLPLQKINVNYQLLSLHWLNTRTMAILDTKEKLRVLDVSTQSELEVVDLTQSKMVYGSSFFKGIATGGNVSRAFALAGERACYNSIICLNNQIIVLGTKSVHALTVRPWNERLEYLTKQFHFLDALSLGYGIYTDKAKAIIGLKGSKDSRRRKIREKLLEILSEYVERIPILNYMDDLNTAKQNYSEVISACVRYYILLDQRDPIFEQLYDLCQINPVSKSAFLESLEPYILNDQLRSMSPSIVKDFITYYEEMGSFKALEACIVRLSVGTIDIHQTMKICWTMGLYDAIIYIYNQGMLDYISPFEELMTELESSINSTTNSNTELLDGQISLGNKILVYTACCLSGRAYPYGNIPENITEKVQSDIFQTLISLHTKNSSEHELSYPYLRTFLAFDTREFFNVLSMSFEEPHFQAELGKRQKQRMVDILLQVMVEGGSYTPTQVGCLFTFLARQIAKKEQSLFVSKLLFEQVLENLASSNDTSRIDERQQALLELLLAGGIQHFDHEKLLEKCLKAKFYRVCEMLYLRKLEYEKVLDCYLLDKSRENLVFSYIHKMFCNSSIKKEEIQNKIKQNLIKLVEIDNKKSAQVILYYMGSQIPDLIKSIKENPEKQYLFLQGIFIISEENQSIQHINESITEKYIDLMCQFNHQMVYPFLKTVNTYRLEETLEICKKYKLIEAIGYLLEKDGKISEAFMLMLDQFKVKLKSEIEEIESWDLKESGEILTEKLNSRVSWSQLQVLFLVIIQFSQRNSPKFIREERENLWLPLLELIISAAKKFQETLPINKAFNDMIKHLLSSMMDHVSLPTIVEIIMNDSSYEKATYGEVKELIQGMLETCTYEEMMVELVKRITQSDLHDKLTKKANTCKRSFTPKNKNCPICHSSLLPTTLPLSQINVLVFGCGHGFHSNCCDGQYKVCILCQIGKRPEGNSFNNNNTNGNGKGEDSIFQIPQLNSRESDSEEEGDVTNGHLLTHSEFELKLDFPTKVNLAERF